MADGQDLRIDGTGTVQPGAPCDVVARVAQGGWSGERLVFEAALDARVAEMLEPLRPPSDGGVPSSRQITPSSISARRRGQLENA